MFSLFSSPPASLGVVNGHLADCPPLPNCVCTQARDPAHQVEPLRFTDSPAEAMQRLKAILTDMPRTKIITSDDCYLRAECTSLVFRFVDDVEFLRDPATRTIHFRSASRVGKSDLGVNRRRMEAIRKKFDEHQRKGNQP